MTIRTFTPKGVFDPQAEQIINRLFELIYQLQDAQSKSATPASVKQQLTNLGLLNILGQPVLGLAGSDPQLSSLPVTPGTGTVTSITVTGDPSNGLNSAGSPVTGSGTITLTFGASVNVATSYKVATVQVVGARQTGWGAAAGTLSRAAYVSYAGQTVSAAYVQAEAQATDDAVKAIGRRLAALITDLRTHGLIGN